MMSIRWIMLALMLALGNSLAAQSSEQPPGDEEALTELLHEFMAGASRNEISAHDRFWDADLVYTSSAGERFGKAEIMQGLRDEAGRENAEPPTMYRAEDIRIRLFGDSAVVAFRLLGQPREGAATEYLNTGTFVRREGGWRAVAWQATRVPRPE
jgi:hypothetical protein